MRRIAIPLVAFAPLFASFAVGLGVPQASGVSISSLIDNFDDEDTRAGQLEVSDLINFDVTAGTIDLIGNGVFDFFPGNGLYVDLNGALAGSGTLVSKADFLPGEYTLSFVLGNNPMPFPRSDPFEQGTENSVTISLGEYTETIERFGAIPPETFTRTVLVNSDSKLSFATPFADNDRAGVLLFSVDVARIPEPSAAILGVLGGFALGGIRRSGCHRIC